MYSMMEDSIDNNRSAKFKKLTQAICGLVSEVLHLILHLILDQNLFLNVFVCGQVDDYSMVRFLPFDRTDEEGMNIVLQNIDFCIQYGEDLEFKEPKVKQ